MLQALLFSADISVETIIRDMLQALVCYGGTAYQDPANQDPLSQNSENIALVN